MKTTSSAPEAALIGALLSSVADLRPRVASWLAEEDPDKVAVAVLSEVAGRAALVDGPAAPVAVQFDLGVPGRRLGYRVTAGGAGGIEPGWADDPWVLIRQDLGDLLHTVYGPSGHRPGTLEVHVKDQPGPQSADPADPWTVQREHARRAAYQALAACAGPPHDLTALALRFGTDKWGGHWYTPHYARYLEPFRDRPVRLLELGIGGYDDPAAGGASLRVWKHYFRRGLIYGLDIHDKSGLAEPRIHPLVGDQGDGARLAEVGREFGPFDIVIDDGSHLNSDVIASFTALFPHVADNGLYVVEDLQTSYWPGWGGDSGDLNDPATSVGFIKTLIDGLNHAEQVRPPGRPEGAFERTVVGVQLHHNIAFIEKGANTERSYPPWVPRMTYPLGPNAVRPPQKQSPE